MEIAHGEKYWSDITHRFGANLAVIAAQKWIRQATASSVALTAQPVRLPAHSGSWKARARFGLEVRAGIHTGECELVGEKIAGISVVTGSRISSLAASGAILVSSTIKDLVAGSGFGFEDRGERELKGVPREWHLYAVTALESG